MVLDDVDSFSFAAVALENQELYIVYIEVFCNEKLQIRFSIEADFMVLFRSHRYTTYEFQCVTVLNGTQQASPTSVGAIHVKKHRNVMHQPVRANTICQRGSSDSCCIFTLAVDVCHMHMYND